ncbi:MAG TPA: cytochrome c3 family protein [Bacteroidota bacterium]
MRRFALLGFVTFAAVLSFAGLAVAQDKCLTCHETIEDKPSTLYKHDIHFLKGISCAACHGGDSKSEEIEEAMDPAKGYIGVPTGDAISQRCATCHSDPEKMKSYKSTLPTGQWEALQESVHGKLAISGTAKIGQCTTCHGAHGIVSAKNPASPVYPLKVVKTCATCHADASFMRLYNPSLAVDQLDKYRTSVHGARNAKGDAKVAECASCHGSHDIRTVKDAKSSVYPTNVPQTCATCHSNTEYMKAYNIPTDQFEKFTTSVHGKALLEKKDLGAPACNSCHGNHGAVPPGISSISKVCGTCHALNADLFSSSPHKKAFDDRKLPECETCHSNHAIVAATNELLGVTKEAVCSRCHSSTENIKGFAVAQTMRSLIEELETSVAHASTLVDEAEQKGMEVGEAKFKLRDARQARLQSRTMVHSFDEEQFREIVDTGLNTATTVAGEADEAIAEYFFRRIGLGIATLIITLLAFSLYWYIRRLERHQSKAG